MTWSTWFLWVAVSAADPVLWSIAATALLKPVLATDPHATAISWALGVLIVVAVVSPALLQWAVLRRMAPALRLWLWLAAALVAGAVSLALALKAGDVSGGGRQFFIAGIKFGFDPSLSAFLGLPWDRLLLSAAAVTAATVLVPAWVFARAAGLRWYVPLLAAIAGACCVAVADQVYHLGGFHARPSMDIAMNAWSWTDRVRELCLRGGAGALGGAISGLIVVLFARKGMEPEPPASRFPIGSPRGAGALLAAPVLIAMAAPAGAFILDREGREAGLNWLSKAFSSAPSSDVAEGEEVLRYSHTATMDPAEYPVAEFSPDGESFIVMTADRRLMRIDTATGKALGTVAEPLRRYERHALAWSPDGRFLALRTDGEEVPIPKPPYYYTRHRARFRIYALPDYGVVGDYSHVKDECFDSYASPSMMFEADGKSLWVVCGQYDYPGPESLMAIRLEAPSMRVLELRRYGDGATGEAVRGLARKGRSIWYWQHAGAYSHQFRLGDLTRNREVAHIPDLKQPRFAGDFTWQDAQVTETRITLRYRGGPLSGRGTMRSLVFDTRSGKLIEKRDQPESPLDFNRRALDASDELRIETISRDDSKAGEIDVIDGVSGKRRQRILTLAQRPVGISPDGRWIVMHAHQQNTLRLYRLTPSPAS